MLPRAVGKGGKTPPKCMSVMNDNRSTKFDVLSACNRNGVQKNDIRKSIMYVVVTCIVQNIKSQNGFNGDR